MRIVSLNAWGGAMWDALAEWLPGCGADVLCLHEVTRTPDLIGWTRFSDAERDLPQRADLFDDVATLVPSHDGIPTVPTVPERTRGQARGGTP